MKTALIFFNEKLNKLDGEYLSAISEIFVSGGIELSTVECLSVLDEAGFTDSLTRFKTVYDNLVIMDNGCLLFDVKKVISNIFSRSLCEDETAKSFMSAVEKLNNVQSSGAECLIPNNSVLIPNISGVRQGFILEDNNFVLGYFPSELEQFKVMLEKYYLPYLFKKHNIEYKRLTLKYFGDKNVLISTIEKAKVISEYDFDYEILENYGDIKLDLIFVNYKRDKADMAIRHIISELKDSVYAEYNVSLSERLFDILRLRNLRLSTAESFTGGRIVSSLINNSGASNIIVEGVVAYSNMSKEERLNVKRDDLMREGAVSSVVAYQMALGLLKNQNTDVAIATTGIAGPKSDDSGKPVGLCYIAVGMKDGIHTYKFNFNGTRENITETAKNTALFLGIKKLKNL